jgi:hypothetical protein
MTDVGPGELTPPSSSLRQLPQLSHLQRVVEIVPPESSSRALQRRSNSEDEEEDPILSSGLSQQGDPQDDTATAHPPLASSIGISSSSSIICTHEIFYSSTYSTPVLYLHAHYTQTGQDLSLEEMMDPRLGVFLPGEDGRGNSPEGAEGSRRSTLHALLPRESSGGRGGDEGPTLAVPLVEDDASTASKDEAVPPAYFPPLSLSDHPITSLPCISLHPCQTAVVIGEMMQSHGVSAKRDGDHHEGEESVYGREYLEAFMTICASAVEMRG